MARRTDYGTWDVACDSYGKVRHSKKACIYTTILERDGERIIKVAAQIPDWEEARLMCSAPILLAALKSLMAACPLGTTKVALAMEEASKAIAAAEPQKHR